MNGARLQATTSRRRSRNTPLCSAMLSPRHERPPASSGHPRLMILGLLEARLLSFDRVLLAGLDETVWPPAVETDAFLNRPMRAALGLSAPERRIGQTAHDFVAALGASEAILSRAKKRGGEPTVASRFLQRMAAAGRAQGDDRAGRARATLSQVRACSGPAGRRPGSGKASAAPSRRTSPKGAQRDANRDFASRPLRDLRRNHSPAAGARGGRTRNWAARNRNGVARRGAAICRSLSVRRPACRCARTSPLYCASMLCAAP